LQAEEARFRAQLQELEQQRMGVIEAAWRAREAQRQSEITAMKAKYAALEQQTRELLMATQERERALLAAEAELRLRKAGLEREAAGRMTEAEAAVRRLQVSLLCSRD
jgi:centrosomal protein CEP120